MIFKKMGTALAIHLLAAVTLAMAVPQVSAETFGEVANKSLQLYQKQLNNQCKAYRGETDERRRCMLVVSEEFLRQYGAWCGSVPDTFISGCSMAELTVAKTREKLGGK